MTSKFLIRAAVGAFAATSIGLFGALPATAATTTTGGDSTSTGGGSAQSPFSGTAHTVCSSAPAGYASCLARIITPGSEQSHLSYFSHRATNDRGGAPAVTVSGLGPTNIESVYGFSTSTSAGSGKTIALVDAYDDATVAADLSTFSTQWGLPSCTTTNGCFTKVNQTGGTSLPASNTTLAQEWALEISLDVEWAHAVAPGAKILLVEANSASLNDLLTAETYAGAHANYVSNSWGASEFNTETSYDSDFSGSASYFASTGDSASAVDYPATSPKVVAVGGTSLQFNSNGSLASETAWSAGGGGCSSYETAPSAQASFAQYAQAGCTGRAVPDVALDADPASGVSVYDSTPYPGFTGTSWFTVGGTSVSSPIWAAETAVAGISASPQTLYGSSGTPSFRDVTGGSNGHPTLVGYDLATGRGSWANGAPQAATALAATGSSGAVALSWTAGSGATSYDVYRGTNSGAESTTPIATNVTGTTYNDTTVTNGNAYFYEVEGVNSVGTGVPSNQATATPSSSGGGGGGGGQPPTKPGAPGTLSATPGSGLIALQWGTASRATSYNVLRGTTPNGESATPIATNVTSLTYGDTNVAPGITYYYEVVGVDGAGKGPVSNEAHATLPAHSLTASIAKSCSSSVCQFTSTSVDSGGQISSYSWTVGSSFMGNSPTFFERFTNAGHYTVNLTIQDSTGSTSSATTTVVCQGGGRSLSCS